ncbi:MAG: type VI secretion system amidase effector protein Tae4 [Proteobacteria bacterium]|nr:type VI secretion system amidase effector protein Tae4 [Pseudomonadota bacterium]
MVRPSFITAWAAFAAVKLPVNQVGKKMGGNVQKHIELPTGGFENACPIRMSYVLNSTGFLIHKSGLYVTVTGGDNRQYIYRVGDMINYLNMVFGKPDKVVKFPKAADFVNMKGIIAVKGHGWINAKGHVTLWDGKKCADSCHFMYDPDNGPFIPEVASIWVLH